ncbi:transaldolase [Streptomyces sp. APSN-46.1]|uniref:transaldolase family protein n=1 Tax=Streptomyces sp. APSN-46.1 TaxID=2929049 RepID=UPI001FB48F7E|nr:transaldolase family protein [Streptomyces sp. APSN-46.1]MCJ1678534.1 transaldolase [Streptomyces sp. APSN-46.1]
MLRQPAIGLLKRLAAEGVSPWMTVADGEEFIPGFHGAVAPVLALETVRRACDALGNAFVESGGRQGRVSVPVDPWLGHDAESMVSAARSVHGDVGRPNLLIRIPATGAGLAALEECLSLGISVHADLIFSAERYEEVLGAYLAGMERALSRGLWLRRIAVVTSVPVGVLDAEVNSRLAAPANPGSANPGVTAAGARDTAAVAVARQLYRVREQRLGGEWWRVLRVAGAAPPGLLWTEVRPRHVSSLVGWNTAQAVTRGVLEAAAAAEQLRGDTLLNAHAEARRALDALDGLGIRMADVARELEAAELDRLRRSWTLRP